MKLSVILHVTLGEEFLTVHGGGEHLRYWRGMPVIIIVELFISHALLGEMNDSRASATGADFGVQGGMSQINVCLVATLDGSHRELILGTDVECLALEKLNLGDNLVSLDRGALARLDRDILALSDNLNGALVTVEELKADTLVDLIRVIETNSLVSEVLNDPLVATELSYRLCRRLLSGSCLGWGGFSRSGNLLLLNGGCCGSSSRGSCRSGRLGSKEGSSTCTILSALPVTDRFTSVPDEGEVGGHELKVGFEPCLLTILSLFADSVSVEKNLRFDLGEVVVQEIVAWSGVPEEELEAIIANFHDVHG